VLDKAQYSAFESTLNSDIVSYRIVSVLRALRSYIPVILMLDIIWNTVCKYGIHTSKSILECMEKIQRRATKLVHDFNKMPYEQRLKALGLYSLQRRRLRGDLIDTYKILTVKEKIKSDLLFQKATTTELRGHSLKLYKEFQT